MRVLLFFVGFLMGVCAFVGCCCIRVGSSHDGDWS